MNFYLCAYADCSNRNDVLGIKAENANSAAFSFVALRGTPGDQARDSIADVYVEQAGIRVCLIYRITPCCGDWLCSRLLGNADQLLSALSITAEMRLLDQVAEHGEVAVNRAIQRYLASMSAHIDTDDGWVWNDRWLNGSELDALVDALDASVASTTAKA